MRKKRSELSRYLTGDDQATRRNGYGLDRPRKKPKAKRGGSRS